MVKLAVKKAGYRDADNSHAKRMSRPGDPAIGSVKWSGLLFMSRGLKPARFPLNEDVQGKKCGHYKIGDVHYLAHF